jgi:probable HAF family extracellular repeat protein
LGKLFKVSAPLGASPKASLLAADKTTFKKGDKVTFVVTLDPATYKYPYQVPEVGYNIRDVRLYRRAATGDLTPLVSQTPSGEQREFRLEWTSDVDGSLGKDYFAFVTPVFLPLELELGYVGQPLLLTCTTPPAGARYCVIEIGTLGGGISEAYDLNEKGQVVGYAATKANTNHAFLWQNGSLTDLTVNANAAGGVSINENGQVVGFWRSGVSSPAQAFSWQNGTFSDLGLFGSSKGIAADICVNNAGQIVTTILEPPSAILLQNGTVTQLKDPANLGSHVGCINEKGQVAGDGFVSNPSGPLKRHALLWQGGSVTDLGPVPTDNYGILVTDLNDSAAVVGYSPSVNNLPGRAFLWQGGQVSDLGNLGGSNSVALGINNNGQIVGMSQKFNLEMAAALWEGTTIRNFNILIGEGTGWQLDVAYDINDKGYVVGAGRHNGALHGFLLVPAQP